jgi:4-diphosphocytidyl-2-C-methyl-D-erythritol kinase
MRNCKLRCLAKVNLDLRVLHKRPDGYHELRTVFQTISLADTLEIAFSPARRTRIEIAGNIEIPDNLVARAAQAVLDAARVTGLVRFQLFKRIPMGAGLGGGSSNAAAVLLALPALAGKRLSPEMLTRLGADLGSDVPFFLHGGTALGVGRGAELYPLPDAPALAGLVAAAPIHISTPEAYRALQRSGLTTAGADLDTGNFQAFVWGLGEDRPANAWSSLPSNDFEGAVFSSYPQLKSIRDRFRKLGAEPALMSGSGSAILGLWKSRSEVAEAAAAFGLKDVPLYRISLVNRRRYQALWWKQLGEHVTGNIWPPQSRYAQR